MKTLSNDALLVAPRQELIDTISNMATKIDELQFQLDWFKRQVFGTKSERFIADDDQQTMLELGISETELSETTEQITYSRQKAAKEQPKGHGRGTMPTHLPFIDVVIEPENDTTGLVKIGEEITWHYEMKPGSLFVRRIIRPKFALPNDNGVVIGQLPALPIEKGNAGLN